MFARDRFRTQEQELAELQLARLQTTVARLYVRSPYYRQKLDRQGVRPEHIRTLEDIRLLPFTDKEELRENYPFGLMAAPEEEIVRIHASSGTTGKKTVTGYTRRDIDDWANMMARCLAMAGVTPADRVQITPGFGLWTAGVGFQLGVERLGAMAIPVGPVPVEQQLEAMVDFGATVVIGTSSYGLLLGEEIQRRGLRDQLRLRVGIFGSERWSDKMRGRIEELLGVETFDIIGMTELYGPGIGLDCRYHQGIHYWAEHFIFEIIDSVTGQPCVPGETGELVATTLTREGMPLLRYRTRDITRLRPGPCSCGQNYPRIDRLLGRTDDMIKFRGVNIYPGQIDHVLSGFDGVGSEYLIYLDRVGGKDTMEVRVEAVPDSGKDRGQMAGELIEQVKNRIGVTVQVQILDYGQLPRSAKKSKRVVDTREAGL